MVGFSLYKQYSVLTTLHLCSVILSPIVNPSLSPSLFLIFYTPLPFFLTLQIFFQFLRYLSYCNFSDSTIDFSFLFVLPFGSVLCSVLIRQPSTWRTSAFSNYLTMEFEAALFIHPTPECKVRRTLVPCIIQLFQILHASKSELPLGP